LKKKGIAAFTQENNLRAAITSFRAPDFWDVLNQKRRLIRAELAFRRGRLLQDGKN